MIYRSLDLRPSEAIEIYGFHLKIDFSFIAVSAEKALRPMKEIVMIFSLLYNESFRFGKIILWK